MSYTPKDQAAKKIAQLSANAGSGGVDIGLVASLRIFPAFFGTNRPPGPSFALNCAI